VILITRLNGRVFVVNADLIETIESTPDTVITLTSGSKYIVRESVDEIVSRVITFRRRANQPLDEQAPEPMGEYPVASPPPSGEVE
jgi:flagellar protein FlbD